MNILVFANTTDNNEMKMLRSDLERKGKEYEK